MNMSQRLKMSLFSSKICHHPCTKNHPSYHSLAGIWLHPKESQEVASFFLRTIALSKKSLGSLKPQGISQTLDLF